MVRAVHRSFYIQATFTYERMLALGYTVCLLPFLRKLGASDSEMHDILKNNLKYFNTNPFLSTWVLGAEMNLQEQRLTGEGPRLEQVERFRKRISQALAGPGDNLFWAALRPVSVLLGVMASCISPVAALVTTFVTFNMPSFYVRLSGVIFGYRHGLNVVTVTNFDQYNRAARILVKVGAFILVPAAVLMKTQSQTHEWTAIIAVLLAGGIMYFLLRKGWSVTLNLLILLVGVALYASFVAAFSAF